MSTTADDTFRLVEGLVERDPRYRVEAYLFTLEALNSTLENRRLEGKEGHIDGRELLFGLRDLARKQFGYLARAVFLEWGIARTDDFGEIVFNLVDAKLLSKQESDSKHDFAGVFDFGQAFEAQYIH